MKNNPRIQFLSRREIKRYQEKRLSDALEYLQTHSAFYQNLFKDNKIDIGKIKKIEDLTCVPVTTKTDLQLHNQEFRCVPQERIIDYVTTSGTLGDPVTFTETDEDLDHLAYNEFLSF